MCDTFDIRMFRKGQRAVQSDWNLQIKLLQWRLGDGQRNDVQNVTW